MPLSYRLLQSLLLYVNLILLRLLGEVKVVSHLYAKVKVTQALCVGIRSGQDASVSCWRKRRWGMLYLVVSKCS